MAVLSVRHDVSRVGISLRAAWPASTREGTRGMDWERRVGSQPWSACGGGLLADPAQLHAGRLERLHGAVERWRHDHDVVERENPVGMGAARERRAASGAGGWQAVELAVVVAQSAQRPAQDPPPRAIAGEAQAHGAELTDAVADEEVERAPALGPVGEHELIDAHPAGCARVFAHGTSTIFFEAPSRRAAQAAPP